MFGVSLPNTEHQLAFLQHQYQQLQQENMFYQTCIKNQQQQLEELKAKQIHALLRKKKRIGALHWQQKTTKTTSELQKTPPTLKPYFELKNSERAHRNIEIKRKFSEVASSLYSDITSVKVELEFHNGKNKYFYPWAPASASDDNSELKYSNRINDRDIIQHVLMVKNKTPERKGGSIPEAPLSFEAV